MVANKCLHADGRSPVRHTFGRNRMSTNRIITLVALSLSFVSHISAEQLSLDNATSATLTFEEQIDPNGSYSRVVLVFLNITNEHDSTISWICNPVRDIEAELILPKDITLPHAPTFASIQSSDTQQVIPYGSTLKWLISHGGISMIGDRGHCYALIVGGSGWLIPSDIVSSCALKIKVRGEPWSKSTQTREKQQRELLFDVSETPITIKIAEHGPPRDSAPATGSPSP